MMDVITRIEGTLKGVDNFLNNLGNGVVNFQAVSKPDRALKKKLRALHGYPITSQSNGSPDDYSHLLSESEQGNFSISA